MRNQHSAFSNRHLAVVAVALAFLALHLPYLPQSLEDADSINFALGVHAFDVARHQPHPPGYPLFIAIVRGVRTVVSTDVRALSLVGAVAGAVGVLLIAALFRRLGGGLTGTLLAMATPLYWFTANRPLSDMTGLAAVVAVQLLILRASTARAFAIAALCAGLAVGLRSQIFWLTAPLLIASGLGAGDVGLDRNRPGPSSKPPALPLFAYAIGVLLWAVPLVALSGGPRGYWSAVFEQGHEDLSGIRMLWTTPTARELVDAVYYALVAPWAVWPLATIVLLLAAIGAASLWRRKRSVLTWLAIAYGPYLAFDLLFQETFTSRYALPFVVPIACLAGFGAWAIPANAGVAAAIAAAMFGAHVGGTSLAAYASQPAPAFRLLADMGRAATAPVAVAMDRREELDLRAPAKFLRGYPPNLEVLLSRPQHEALDAARELTGTHKPLWFIADPKRADIDLIQHGEPRRYRWSLPYPVLIDGVRPNEMDWHELDAPDWWLDDGWALTPELAGVSNEDRRGLVDGPIGGHLSRAVLGGVMILGGRNFDPTSTSVTVGVGDAWTMRFTAAPGAFVQAWQLPAMVADATARSLPIVVAANPPSRVSLEQFDASARRTLVAFDQGWHEPEYAPATGLRWRWLSDRGNLRIVSATPYGGLVLHLAGESPLKYFPHPSTLTVRADGAQVFTTTLASDFSLAIAIPRPAAFITVETDQTYVPAERSWRAADRRRLGLRIFSCDVRAVSAPGR